MSTVDHWVEKAHYDLDTARVLLDAGRYLYVVFCCQQAVEKALKAIIAQKTNELPPRLHNLPRLAEIAEVTLDPETETFIGKLSGCYIQTRYPDEIAELGKSMTHETAIRMYKDAREVTQWLLSMLE